MRAKFIKEATTKVFGRGDLTSKSFDNLGPKIDRLSKSRKPQNNGIYSTEISELSSYDPRTIVEHIGETSEIIENMYGNLGQKQHVPPKS